MGLFEYWPYVDEHELNLDWVLATMKKLIEEWTHYNTNWEQWKNDTDAAFKSLKEYVTNYFDNLDVQEEINNKLDAMMESGELDNIIEEFFINYFEGGMEVVYHNYASTGDTSYIAIKIPKARYALTFHNCSGDDNDSPTTLESNPFDYLKAHLEADIVTNCNFGGLDYPGRLGGVDYEGTVFTRRLFCYNSTDGSIDVTNEGTTLSDVSEDYDVVFAIGDLLAADGASMAFNETGQCEPRNAFGWNDTHYIILITEGRGNGEKGFTLTELKNKMLQLGADNAINFDGGGSTCLAINNGGNAKKINKFRDFDVEYPGLRKVGLCAVYTRR